jgi:hypothetical protein
MDDRNWREAKLPKWVQDSIEAEMRQTALTAALSWPSEAKPEPLPFRWVEYDMLRGPATEGVFWAEDARKLEIRKRDNVPPEMIRLGDMGYGEWVFRVGDAPQFVGQIVRGYLFASEHEARLWRIWKACEKFAAELLALRRAQP